MEEIHCSTPLQLNWSANSVQQAQRLELEEMSSSAGGWRLENVGWQTLKFLELSQ